MKQTLIAQGWNLGLLCIAVVLGWLFPREIGWVLNGFSFTTGSWIAPVDMLGFFLGIPLIAIFLLALLGRRWWYFWVLLVTSFFAWIFFPEDADDVRFLLVWLASPLVVGVVIRVLIKLVPFPKIFARVK